LGYTTINLARGTPMDFRFKAELKLMGEKKVFKKELKAPFHHTKLNLKRPHNAFGDKLSPNM
jgi:hypothetical protein